MPKLITSTTSRKNFRWDAKRKQWVGWQIDVYVNQGPGKKLKRYRTTYPTESEARSAESRLRVKSDNIRLGIETPDDRKEVRVEDLLNKKLAKFEKTKERIAATRVFQIFIDLLDVEYVSELRAAHFHKFIDARLAKGLKPQSVRREMSPLSSAMKSAGEMFPELEDWTPPKIPRPSAKNGRRERIVTEDEKNKIVGHLMRPRGAGEPEKKFENRQRIGRMFLFGWLTGLRLGEIQKLRKTDYAPERRSLRVVRWKTGNTTNFDFLPDEILEVLDAAAAASETDYIFTIAGGPPKNFYAILRDACAKFRIPFGHDAENGICFHDTRHSFITRLVQVTDIATAKSYSGHNDKALVAYYSHATDESRRAAMEKLYEPKRENSLEILREIFEKVQNKQIDFEAFATAISEHFSRQ